MNCATCKHWTRYTDGFDQHYHGPHAGECSNKHFTYGSVNVPINGLVYWDYEGYSAEFATGEDFGCIHWEEKCTAS